MDSYAATEISMTSARPLRVIVKWSRSRARSRDQWLRPAGRPMLDLRAHGGRELAENPRQIPFRRPAI